MHKLSTDLCATTVAILYCSAFIRARPTHLKLLAGCPLSAPATCTHGRYHPRSAWLSRLFRLRRDHWAVELLWFNRCECLTASELDCLDAEHGSAQCSATIMQHEENNSNNTVCRRTDRGPVEGGSVGVLLESGDGGRTEGDARGAPAGAFPFRALSADNELLALAEIVMCLVKARDAFPTTLEHDEVRPTHAAHTYHVE